MGSWRNLERGDLDDMERAEQTAEYIKKTAEKQAREGRAVSDEVRQKLSKRGRDEGRPESGMAAACRELGIAKSTALDAVSWLSIRPNSLIISTRPSARLSPSWSICQSSAFCRSCASALADRSA